MRWLFRELSELTLVHYALIVALVAILGAQGLLASAR